MTFGLTKSKGEHAWTQYGLGGRIDQDFEIATTGLVQKCLLEKKTFRRITLTTTLSLEEVSLYFKENGYNLFLLSFFIVSSIHPFPMKYPMRNQ